MTLAEELRSSRPSDLYTGDELNHYAAGAVWKGDWRKGRLTKGWFGNDFKPRHYAVSMGRQSSRYVYANNLLFFPMTSLPQDETAPLLVISPEELSFLTRETYVVPIRLLVTDEELERSVDASYIGDFSNSLLRQLKQAWSDRYRSSRL